ncbi:putative f-box domain-containing protein [Diaporthe ampelina]|uniref:Putative f-box domain-containing protein n=1 Tax=Diaporthe ampelina TaxID=1214573 RepID=A0A0G2H5P2_9PEZI|nr:putative f-box domain-containing protein [Diaporthe ampelina]
MSASPPASSMASSSLVAESSDSTPTEAELNSLRTDSTLSADGVNLSSQLVESSQPGSQSDQPNAQSSQPQSVPSHATWPLDAVPVEIFNLIILHLTRKDVQAMRLVSREFDSKLADTFFRNVVVPFRPEFEALYGTLNIDLGFSADQQKYGLVLKKRADESPATDDGDDNQARANPAANGDESLLSDGYRVFEQFGRTHIKKFALALELDEMDLACPPVKLNQEIVPAPWGLYRWPIMDYQRYAQLEGIEKLADETQHMKRAFQFLRVVSEIGLSCDAGLGYLQGPDTNPLCRRVQPSVFRPTIFGDKETDSEEKSDEDSDRSMSLIILKQMAMNAGYDSNEWPRAVLRLLEDEGRAVKWVEQVSDSGAPSHQKIPLFEVTKDTTREDIIQVIETLIGDDDQDSVEMLLELEWAHRALMDSYVIAVMDNKDSFQALSTLTIARCSGRHVPSLMKTEFWGTMTCLRSFHLGVIPDWRRLHKDDTGGVSQTRISPIENYGAVFNLLHKFVGEQKNIKHVSFEWICGGEFAVGKSQRDRYIMPAPVLADAPNMVDLQHSFGEEDVINLPYVEKLTLKNCWFTPHVFLNVAKKMSRDMLRDLELDLDMSPEAVHAHLEHMDRDDNFYRNIKLNEQRFSMMFHDIPENRGGQDRLKTITFKSCGYALIESSHISNWKIIPNESLLVQHDNDFPNQLKDLDTQMLICNDGLLGKVLNYIPGKEQRILSGVFGLSFGWDDIYDDIVSQIAIMDGNPDPGAGRFHGTVSRSAETEIISLKAKGKQIASRST